jgi:hypothetical protein
LPESASFTEFEHASSTPPAFEVIKFEINRYETLTPMNVIEFGRPDEP